MFIKGEADLIVNQMSLSLYLQDVKLQEYKDKNILTPESSQVGAMGQIEERRSYHLSTDQTW